MAFAEDIHKHKHSKLKSVGPDDHHRKWSWADEQGWNRHFALPFADQYDWTKQGAVFDPTENVGDFDKDYVQHPCVLRFNDYYYLFYCGGTAATLGNGIGVARSTSPSGPFTRLNGGNTLVNIPAGQTHIACPNVIYDIYETASNKKWKMWVNSNDNSTPQIQSIWYSYSANPDTGWAALAKINSITEEQRQWGPSFIKFGRLYYALIPDGFPESQLELWVSKNPDANWVSQGIKITLGAGGAWDDSNIRYITITYILGTFYCFYSAYDGATSLKIGMALSSNGWDYTKYAKNPLVTDGGVGDPDATHAFAPSILQVEEKFYMWYCGVNPTDRKICLATIP